MYVLYNVIWIFKRIIVGAGALQALHTFTKPWTHHIGIFLIEQKTQKTKVYLSYFIISQFKKTCKLSFVDAGESASPAKTNVHLNQKGHKR